MGTSPASESQATSSSASSHGSQSGSHQSELGQARRDSFCVFTVEDRAYAIETHLVGALVKVEEVTPVPLAPAAVLGLFNLRGQPVALIDAALLLGFTSKPRLDRLQALVLKTDHVVAALGIERMEAVISAQDARFTPRGAGEEQPLVGGFIDVNLKRVKTATVIDAHALLQSFNSLKFTT